MNRREGIQQWTAFFVQSNVTHGLLIVSDGTLILGCRGGRKPWKKEQTHTGPSPETANPPIGLSPQRTHRAFKSHASLGKGCSHQRRPRLFQDTYSTSASMRERNFQYSAEETKDTADGIEDCGDLEGEQKKERIKDTGRFLKPLHAGT